MPHTPAIHGEQLPDPVIVGLDPAAIGHLEQQEGQVAVEIKILRPVDIVALPRNAQAAQIVPSGQSGNRPFDGGQQGRRCGPVAALRGDHRFGAFPHRHLL